MRHELRIARAVSDTPVCYLRNRVDIQDAFALSVCARYFDVPEQTVKNAVAMVGDDFDQISRQLQFLKSKPVVL